MPLLAILDEASHGSLDDSLKTFYVQNSENKQYYLDVSPDEAGKLAFGLQEKVTKLEGNNRTLLTEKTNVLERLKPFEGLGKTAEEIIEMINSKRPEDVNTLINNHKTEIETLKKSYEEPIGKLTERANTISDKYQRVLSDAAIQKLRNEFDLNETADFVLRDFIRVVPESDDSDEYVVRVYENGKEAMVAGQAMTPDQLIKSFQESKKFPAMFNTGSGGGTGNTSRRQSAGNAGSKSMSRSEFDKLDHSARHKFLVIDGGAVVD